MSNMHVAQGLVFLAVSTGIGTFVSLIATSIAVGDEEEYAGFLVIVTIILAITFLVSGFLGFALK